MRTRKLESSVQAIKQTGIVKEIISSTDNESLNILSSTYILKSFVKSFVKYTFKQKQRFTTQAILYTIQLTVNSICSFWQLTGIWGMWKTIPLRSLELLAVWSWNFYLMSSTIGRHEFQKIFYPIILHISTCAYSKDN